MYFKVFEHLTGSAFFELYESHTVTVADSHLQRIVEHIGGFPPNFLVGCSRRSQYFNEQGEQSKISLFLLFSYLDFRRKAPPCEGAVSAPHRRMHCIL